MCVLRLKRLKKLGKRGSISAKAGGGFDRFVRFELELLQIFTHVAQGGAQSRGTTAFMNSFTPIADDALASPLNFPEGCFIFYVYVRVAVRESFASVVLILAHEGMIEHGWPIQSLLRFFVQQSLQKRFERRRHRVRPRNDILDDSLHQCVHGRRVKRSFTDE